jgi:cation diffusion facilitator CzcD-associated flavoprotein CzcO
MDDAMASRAGAVGEGERGIGVDVEVDVVVIGAGQAGLCAGWWLRRSGLSFVLLDDGEGPGGAWRHGWDSLRLFSPAAWSSIAGMPMPPASPWPPGTPDAAAAPTPSRDDVLAYLAEYERRYALPVERPVRVVAVERAEADALHVRADDGRTWRARAVISATGTWSAPHIPDVPGRADFAGTQLHSAHYRSPAPFAGQRVLVVGGGNSGAQLYAELDLVADATWVTLSPPSFLPDEVDGRALFERATARFEALQAGRVPDAPVRGLGDIVMVPPVRAARARGRLQAAPMFSALTRDGVVWPDGRDERIDAIVWCTGFRPALGHLAPLGVREADGRVAVDGTRSTREPALWLLGYGEWTGPASATLIGVNRSARDTVAAIRAMLAPALGDPA